MKFFGILLLFYSSTLFSQSFISYYQKTNRAEICIVDKNYARALELYKTAFNSVKSPFLKDLYNATICASYTKNIDDGLFFIKKVMNTGNSINLFKSRVFRNIHKDKRWKILKGQSNEIVSQANNRKNKELEKKIDRLFKDDQYFRKKRGSYSVYGDTINKIDSVNSIKLKKIILNLGYPNRNTVKKTIKQLDFYIVVRHYYQNKGYDLSDILLNEVKQGRLEPRVFAELEDKKSFWKNKYSKYGTSIFYKNKGHIKEFRCTEEDVARYNRNRQSIGLSSFEEYKKKVLFNEKKSPFFFNIYEGLVYVHF